MARSDWPLEQRIVLPDSSERLLDLRKIEALHDARGERRDPEVHSPFDALLERYAQTVLQLPGVDPSRPGGRERWRKTVRDGVDQQVGQLRERDRAARKRAAKQLAKLP